MRKTALVYHEDYLKHNVDLKHPEQWERLDRIMSYLREKDILEEVSVLKPDECSVDDLLRVHSMEHVQKVKRFSEIGGNFLDADTYVGPGTYEIARLAAGGVMLAGDTVMQKNHDNSYALVRPPGHHASREHAAGFCFFNNLAVAIRFLQEKYDLERIAVFDWDAHAANGVESIFWEDDSVLNISAHQNPATLFPGSGFIHQIGEGKGLGYTVNIPVPPATGDAEYMYLLEKFVGPLARAYEPELIAISSGIDSHIMDPLSGLQLSTKAYPWMTNFFLDLADELCEGRLFLELEGGYNLESTPEANYEIIKALLGEKEEYKMKGRIRPPVKELVEDLWSLFQRKNPAYMQGINR